MKYCALERQLNWTTLSVEGVDCSPPLPPWGHIIRELPIDGSLSRGTVAQLKTGGACGQLNGFSCEKLAVENLHLRKEQEGTKSGEEKEGRRQEQVAAGNILSK